MTALVALLAAVCVSSDVLATPAVTTNANTPSLLWKFQARQNIGGSPPAVKDGLVYVGSRDLNLYALNAQTGKPAWIFNTTKRDQCWNTPAVADGVVYFGCNDFNLYAVDAKSGALKWKFETGDIIQSSPTVVNGIVFFGSGDNHLYALSANDGELTWRSERIGWVSSSPVVNDGLVYVGSHDGYVFAFNADNGSLIWKFQTISLYVKSNPIVSNGIVYIGSNDEGGPGPTRPVGSWMYALDAKTGALKWKYQANDYLGRAAAVSDGVLYFGSWDNTLRAVDAVNGTLRWSFRCSLGGGIDGSVAVENGIVYFGAEDSRFYALDAKDGKLQWSYSTRPCPVSPACYANSPTLADGVLYFGGGWSLYAFKVPANGSAMLV